MTGCCARGCTSRSERGVGMHRLPQDPTVRGIWEANMGGKPTKWGRLCELHFDETQFDTNSFNGKRQLKRKAVPTLFPQNGCKVRGGRWSNPFPQESCVPACKVAVPEFICHDHVYTFAKPGSTTASVSALEVKNDRTTDKAPLMETTMEELARIDDRIKKLRRKLRRAKKKRKQLYACLRTKWPQPKVVFPGTVDRDAETLGRVELAPGPDQDTSESDCLAVDNLVLFCSQSGPMSDIIPQLLGAGLIRPVDVARTDPENKA